MPSIEKFLTPEKILCRWFAFFLSLSLPFTFLDKCVCSFLLVVLIVYSSFPTEPKMQIQTSKDKRGRERERESEEKRKDIMDACAIVNKSLTTLSLGPRFPRRREEQTLRNMCVWAMENIFWKTFHDSAKKWWISPKEWETKLKIKIFMWESKNVFVISDKKQQKWN